MTVLLSKKEEAQMVLEQADKLDPIARAIFLDNVDLDYYHQIRVLHGVRAAMDWALTAWPASHERELMPSGWNKPYWDMTR